MKPQIICHMINSVCLYRCIKNLIRFDSDRFNHIKFKIYEKCNTYFPDYCLGLS